MSPTIGFNLVTLNKPHQIVRLVETLNRFDRSLIVAHHDFSNRDSKVMDELDVIIS